MKVTRNIDTGDEKQTIRTISTKPKEHFEGRWKSGRLYPLYSVVVNNGTTFISQNAKMKEEPYVIYDADKKEFKAPDGWLIKEMSADSRVTALGGGGEGGVTPEEVEEMIKDKVDKVNGKGLSTNDYDDTEKNKVASAYQKPNNGIPKSDLAKAVQDVLDDADGAYKKPVTGIPFADLADGVQDSLSNADEAKAGLADKQDTLISGTNIKTINGEPILGQGDITIESEDGTGIDDVSSAQDGTIVITLSNGDKVIVDMNHNHPQYYSKMAESAQPSGGFLPDVAYNLGEISGAVTFALAAAVNGQLNHYFWMFSTGGTAPTVTWPSTGITWAAGAAPTVAANKKYEISILGGVAYYSEV